MTEKDTPFSPQESIKLIQSMIEKSRNAYVDNSFYFLFWGWLIFSCCVVQFVLIQMHVPQHYYIWMLTVVGGIVSGIYGSKQSKKITTKTFVDEANEMLWTALIFSFLVLLCINMTTKNGWQNAFGYYILLYAIGTFVTGKLLQFKPLVYGSIINFILAAICSKFSYEFQLLIAATALLTSYIIPGHLLRIQYNKQV
ncbi:MAG: hypothetical protein ACOVNY_11060 [Chitinophagaceae bacterium]